LLLGGTVVNLDGLANNDVVRYMSSNGETLAEYNGGTLAEYIRRERIRYVFDVMPPEYWESLGIKTRVVRTEEIRNPQYPLYYVIRVP
jgi:hypothetical protein